MERGSSVSVLRSGPSHRQRSRHLVEKVLGGQGRFAERVQDRLGVSWTRLRRGADRVGSVFPMVRCGRRQGRAMCLVGRVPALRRCEGCTVRVVVGAAQGILQDGIVLVVKVAKGIDRFRRLRQHKDPSDRRCGSVVVVVGAANGGLNLVARSLPHDDGVWAALTFVRVFSLLRRSRRTRRCRSC